MTVQVDKLVICKGGLKRFRGTDTPLAPAQRKQGARDALKKAGDAATPRAANADGLFFVAILVFPRG